MKALTILISSFLLLISCSKEKDEEPPAIKTGEEKKIIPKRNIIGRIASVSQSKEFVLIQKFGPGKLPENRIYQARGPEGRAASLRLSGERIRDFYAADIVNGTVEKGDSVIYYNTPNEEPEDLEEEEEKNPKTEEETNETNTPTENEQKERLSSP